MSRFEYIFEFKQKNFRSQLEKEYSVKKLCKVLTVSETGYYKWKRNKNNPKAWQILLKKIHEILDEHPENIVNRDFTAKKANVKWLTDITQIPGRDGKLYIAPVMDCFGGEIISLAMDSNMKKELCIKAAKEAYMLRKPKSGFILHSDAGSQYTSLKYKIEQGKMHAIQSMSDVGKCYDNCRMESFFATLKKEKLYQIDTMKMTMEEVKTEVWRFVQYYNRTRICTFNKGGYPSEVYREKVAAGELKVA